MRNGKKDNGSENKAVPEKMECGCPAPRKEKEKRLRYCNNTLPLVHPWNQSGCGHVK
jgi:hypothetical protein